MGDQIESYESYAEIKDLKELSNRELLNEFRIVSENLESTDINYTIEYQSKLYNEVLSRMNGK
ncbi:hypothetical protein J31TS6_11310 [Brevibacillus reuszeri]|uniref:hypothetical protein n=1 Tax=Brevibacillus reuszeri TaxID=54915 RepID=UPI001AFFFD09|nr:hypothetical protein [Brevibacillus reuszeri]GIO05103.1 hypothetical protein J31TS6_11310 [Brevibacillus reuszeri]